MGGNASTNTDKYEYVATIFNGVASGDYGAKNTKIAAANARYRNNYTNATASAGYKQGDATYETTNWKGATYASFVSEGRPVFIRSTAGAFGFHSYSVEFGSYYAEVRRCSIIEYELSCSRSMCPTEFNKVPTGNVVADSISAQ
jgi:hypothetical protein